MRLNRSVLIYISSILALILAAEYDYKTAYEITYLLSIITASAIFLFTWTAGRYLSNRFLLTTGYSFFFIGILQLFHFTSGLNGNLFSVIDENPSEFFTVSERILESTIYLSAALLTDMRNFFNIRNTFCFVLITASLGYSLISVFNPELFNRFSTLVLNALVVANLLATILFIRRHRYNFSGNLVNFLLWSFFTGIVSEIVLISSLFTNEPTDLVGSLIKISSWYILYKAFVVAGIVDNSNSLLQNLTRMKEAESEARKRAEARALELDILRANLTDMLVENDSCRLLKAFVTRAVALLQASGGELCLYDRENQELYSVANHNPRECKGVSIKIGNGIVGLAAKTREPVMLHGQELETYHKNGFSREWNSCMAVPLIVEGNLLGTVMVMENSERRFGAADLNLLFMFAQQAAVAVRNLQLLEDARKKAETDSLTGLYNHRRFFELALKEVTRSLRYRHPLTAIMIDIDHFKEINDTYGHGAGDQVIVSIARQCRRLFRSIDIIGRYGGEEFSVLLPETATHTVRDIAERLRRSVSQAVVSYHGNNITVTISLGIASLGNGCCTINKLMERADRALYHAKNSGRNRVSLWNPSMWKNKIRRQGKKSRIMGSRNLSVNRTQYSNL